MTPTTIASNARTGVTVTWQADSCHATATALYVVYYDTSGGKLRVTKSTDGTSWSEQDSANAITPVADTAYGSYLASNGYIYIVYQLATNSTRVRRFNTATDAWEASDYTAGNAIGGPTNAANHAFPIRLAVRSDGDVLIFYTRTAGALYYTRYEGSSWSAPIAYEASGALAASVCMGPSDLIFVGSSQDASDDQSYRTIDAANTLGSTTDFDTTVNTAMLYHAGIAYVADGGTDRIGAVSVDTGGEVDFYHGTSGATIGSIATVNAALSATGTPYKTSVDVTAFNSKWYVCAVKTTGIVYTGSDDFATPAFNSPSETNLVSLSSVDAMPQFIKGLSGLGIVYTESSAVKVEWITAPSSGSPALAATSGNGTSTVAASRLVLPSQALASSASVGTSTVAASRIVLPSQALAATSAVGTSTAAADHLAVAHAIAGTSDGTSAATASRLIEPHDLAASVTGTSSAAASLIGVPWPLEGNADGISTATATRLIEAQLLAGAIAGTSSATADHLTVAHEIAGQSDGTSTAAASRLIEPITLGGASPGTSTATADHLVVEHALEGSSAGTSTATMITSAVSPVLEGSSAGTSTATAYRIVEPFTLSGSSAGTSSAVATQLIELHALAGMVSDSSSSAASQLLLSHLLAGISDGVSSAFASTLIVTIGPDGTLTANIQIVPVLTASLTVESVLIANVQLLSVLSYTLTIEDTLFANVTILPVVSSILELV